LYSVSGPGGSFSKPARRSSALSSVSLRKPLTRELVNTNDSPGTGRRGQRRAGEREDEETWRPAGRRELPRSRGGARPEHEVPDAARPRGRRSRRRAEGRPWVRSRGSPGPSSRGFHPETRRPAWARPRSLSPAPCGRHGNCVAGRPQPTPRTVSPGRRASFAPHVVQRTSLAAVEKPSRPPRLPSVQPRSNDSHFNSLLRAIVLCKRDRSDGFSLVMAGPFAKPAFCWPSNCTRLLHGEYLDPGGRMPTLRAASSRQHRCSSCWADGPGAISPSAAQGSVRLRPEAPSPVWAGERLPGRYAHPVASRAPGVLRGERRDDPKHPGGPGSRQHSRRRPPGRGTPGQGHHRAHHARR
jgi:hypothetical protein